MLCLRILEYSYSGKGTLPKTWIKTTRLRKKAKRMWVVQVGNGTNGVKNLFVERGKKKMESTAADSLVIVCFVEVSQSCREERPRGALLWRCVGWVGTRQGWGQTGLVTGSLCSLCTRQSGPHLAQTCMWITWWMQELTSPTVSAISLLLWGHRKPRRLQAFLYPQLSCALTCRVLLWVVTCRSEYRLDPAASYISGLGDILGDTCHLSQASSLSVSIAELCADVRNTHFHQLLLPPAPQRSAQALHTCEVTACSHTCSVTEELSDFILKHFCCISLQNSFLYDHQLLILFSACLF